MSTSSASWDGDLTFEKRRALSACLARNWWAMALRGAAAVIFGLIALFMPGVTMISLVLVFAAYMFVDGVAMIVLAVRAAKHHHRAWQMIAASGVASLVAGILAAGWPGITMLVFVMLIAAAQLISGAIMLRSAYLLEHDHGRWWLAIGGVLAILFGVMLIAAPLIGALVLTWWLGAYALAIGIVMLVLSFKLRAKRDLTPATVEPTPQI